MSNRLAAIEYGAHRFVVACALAVIEKCTGFSSYEAGDFLTSPAAAPSPTEAPPAAAGLPTSVLLSRTADLISVGEAFFDGIDVVTPETKAEIDGWTTELRDRAAQFAAHGD